MEVGHSSLFRSYYYRHRDGDRAIYQVTGNVHRGKRLVIGYRRRVLLLPDQQRVSALEVRRDYGDDKARSTFYFEDETSGTTRALGFAEQNKAGVTFYDPPPLTLVWEKAAKRGFSLEIPYRPMAFQGDQRIPLGAMAVDRLVAIGAQDITMRDATGTPVTYRRCVVWRTTTGDGATITRWWGRVGEIVRETYEKGQQRERADLKRLVRR